MANGQGALPSSGACTAAQEDLVFTIHGGATLYGAVFADGCGTVDAGDSGSDINFDASVFGAFRAYNTPTLAKNTFRIIANP